MSSGSPAYFLSERWLKAPGYLHLSAPLELVVFSCYGNTGACRKPGSFILPQTHFTGQFRHTSVSQKESLGPKSQEAVSYCLLSAQEGGEENSRYFSPSQFQAASLPWLVSSWFQLPLDVPSLLALGRPGFASSFCQIASDTSTSNTAASLRSSNLETGLSFCYC